MLPPTGEHGSPSLEERRQRRAILGIVELAQLAVLPSHAKSSLVKVGTKQAVAETVEEMITLIELLDRVDDHQVQLYPSGAATTNTPQPTATPDIVEHDYSRAMANPVVSVRMVRGKRLFSI